MTDIHVGAAAAKALQLPSAQLRAGAVAVKMLQSLEPPADLHVAEVAAKALQRADPDLYLADLSVKVLAQVALDLPDSGQPFQWHTPDAEAPSGWVVDLDRSHAMTAWTAVHGREDAVSKATPVQLTVQLVAALATAPELGERFRIVTTAGIWGTLLTGEARVRATVEVTDVVLNPSSGLIDVTAVGRLARVGRRLVDMRGTRTGLDGTHVARVLELAGADVGAIDGGESTILSQVSDRRQAVQALDDIQDSTLGLVIEQRTGRVDYHDAGHRRASLPLVTFSSSELLLDGFVWNKRSKGIVNAAEVGYGRLDEDVEVRDPYSIDDLDLYPDQRDTLLPDQSAAYDLGLTIVGRFSRPVWELPGVNADLDRVILDPVKRTDVLGLTTGDRVHLDGLPAGGGPTSTDAFVEGVTESVWVKRPARPGFVDPVEDRTAWRLTFAVSDPALSGVTFRWTDVPEDVAWDDVNPDLTWLDLAQAESPDILTNP